MARKTLAHAAPSAPRSAPGGSEMAGELATFIIAGAHYGVDLLRVQEVLHGQARTPIPLAEPGVAGFINLRGQVVLSIDLRTGPVSYTHLRAPETVLDLVCRLL